jgi:hypothetical protein
MYNFVSSIIKNIYPYFVIFIIFISYKRHNKMLPKHQSIMTVFYFLFCCCSKFFVIFISYECNNCGKIEISIFHNVSYITVHFPSYNLAQPEDNLIEPKHVADFRFVVNTCYV